MTGRLTTRERLALFLAAKGRCQRCQLVITPGRRWEVDHVVPRAMGGGGRRANLQVLCALCHGSKTRTEDVPRIAKSKRIQARHLGAWRPSGTLPGGRQSGWKRKMDGTIVRRR